MIVSRDVCKGLKKGVDAINVYACIVYISFFKKDSIITALPEGTSSQHWHPLFLAEHIRYVSVDLEVDL